MKTGDLEPAWLIDIASTDHTADLSGVASWEFIAWRETVDGPDVIFTDTSPTVTPTPGALYQGVASHTWVAGETAGPEGMLHAIVVAKWPGGDEQTFPSEGDARLLLESRPA